MGKIKSAILTAILLAGIVVLAFFATVSYPIAGSNKVSRYDSFINRISLGSDLSGDASAVLYPEGVISYEDYVSGIPDDKESDKYNEYVDKYEILGSVCVEKEVLGENGVNADKLKNDVKHDAEILSKRFGEKDYTSFSVSVKDDYTILVSLPTNFSYSEYRSQFLDSDYVPNTKSDKTSAISNTLTALTYGGGALTLRNNEVSGYGLYDSKLSNYMLTPASKNISDYIKSADSISRAGNHVVEINLTEEGQKLFEDVSAKISSATNDKNLRIFIGDKQLLEVPLSEAVSGDTFYISTNNQVAADNYAIIIDSCVKGDSLALYYGTDDANNLEITYTNASLGDYSAVCLFCAILAIVVAAIVYSCIRYRLLGLVNAIVILMHSLTIIVALLLIEIPFTVAGAFFAVASLALMCGANFALFEKVRGETLKGKTMQSAIKSGYKSLLKGILELHVVLVAVSLIVALVCVGELAASGLIFFIGAIASYVLYWFTRLMWFILSSTVKDKFAFCGFKREELEDD